MTRYISLPEYLWLSEKVTGIDALVLAKSSRIEMADSALHAPQAGMFDKEFYPDLLDKAAVLCSRLVRNHPLPDGNKRAAWASLLLFLDLNDYSWKQKPEVDDAAGTMFGLAAAEISESEFREWLASQVLGSEGDEYVDVVSEEFEGERINISTKNYTNCVFRNCTLTYDGSAAEINGNTFENCLWEFEGSAENTLRFLQGLYHEMGDGGKKLVEQTFQKVRNGQY